MVENVTGGDLHHLWRVSEVHLPRVAQHRNTATPATPQHRNTGNNDAARAPRP